MIEFFDREGVLGTIEYDDGNLVADIMLQDVADAWVVSGRDPADFEDAYTDWSNGYIKSRRVGESKLNDQSPTLSSNVRSFHLPGRHDQNDHGRGNASDTSEKGVSQKITAMLAAYANGYDVIEELSSGASDASIQKIQLSDGTVVIRKSNPRDQTAINAVRAEYLGGLVLNATGVTDMHTAQVDDSTTITTFADGPSSTRTFQPLDDLDFNDYQDAHDRLMRQQVTAKNGKAIGVADHLMMNVDRSTHNWIVPSADVVLPIDQGNAVFAPLPEYESIASGSPFAEYWLGTETDWDTGNITSMKPRITRDDVLTYRERLTALRGEFNRPGEDAYFESMMTRLAGIEMRLPND